LAPLFLPTAAIAVVSVAPGYGFARWEAMHYRAGALFQFGTR
jgi:hypothetical protein